MTIKTLDKQNQGQASYEHGMTGLCANLIASHIEQIHMQVIPVDCVELRDEDFAKMYQIKGSKPRLKL